MVDLIANHVSAESRWFQNYLADQKGFEDLAIEVDPSTDLSMVTRPRSLPLLSEFKKHSGCKVYLWTTFSEDQIDLNYKSLHVLENMEHTRYALTNQSDFLKIDIKVLHYFLSSLFFSPFNIRVNLMTRSTNVAFEIVVKRVYSRKHHENCLSPLPSQNRRGNDCFEAAGLSPARPM